MSPVGARTTWRGKPLFDRRLECFGERAAPSTMWRILYMSCRSEASLARLYRRLAPESQVAALQLEQHVRNAMAQLSNEQLRRVSQLSVPHPRRN